MTKIETAMEVLKNGGYFRKAPAEYKQEMCHVAGDPVCRRTTTRTKGVWHGSCFNSKPGLTKPTIVK